MAVERMEEPEDPSTIPYYKEWYASWYNTLKHHWDRSMVVEADLTERVVSVETSLSLHGKARIDDMSKLGQLMEMIEKQEARIGKLESRFDKASDAMQKLRKQIDEQRKEIDEQRKEIDELKAIKESGAV